MSQSPPPIEGEITLMQRHAWIKRRAEVRYHCGPATSGRLTQEGESQPRRAWILNLSVSGVGLLLDEPLEPETFMVIHVRSGATGTRFELPARVVHATVQTSGEWLVGCELAEKLSPDDLEALL
jgi:PilZ domain